MPSPRSHSQYQSTPDLTENYVSSSRPAHCSSVVACWLLLHCPHLTKEEGVFTQHTAFSAHTTLLSTHSPMVTWGCDHADTTFQLQWAQAQWESEDPDPEE